jgi:hypothetical protein
LSCHICARAAGRNRCPSMSSQDALALHQRLQVIGCSKCLNLDLARWAGETSYGCPLKRTSSSVRWTPPSYAGHGPSTAPGCTSPDEWWSTRWRRPARRADDSGSWSTSPPFPAPGAVSVPPGRSPRSSDTGRVRSTCVLTPPTALPISWGALRQDSRPGPWRNICTARL